MSDSYFKLRRGQKVVKLDITDDTVQQALLDAYSLADIAKMFEVSRITVDIWRLNHGLPTWKVAGRYILIPSYKLEKWMQEKRSVLPKVESYLLRRERAERSRGRVKLR